MGTSCTPVSNRVGLYHQIVQKAMKLCLMAVWRFCVSFPSLSSLNRYARNIYVMHVRTFKSLHAIEYEMSKYILFQQIMDIHNQETQSSISFSQLLLISFIRKIFQISNDYHVCVINAKLYF